MSKLPNKKQRLDRLLGAGYFPEEMPPPFVTSEFAKHSGFFSGRIPSNSKHSAYSSYSIPRHTTSRRVLGIPNPVNYFLLSKEIADNWAEIRKHLRKSVISEFRPIYDTAGPRALFGIDFARVEAEMSRLQASYNRCIRVDISRFYPTIYTHAVGWSLHTKEFVKKNLHKSYKGMLGDRLDRLVRYCQENQSIGIPIGPDTSRIISEIIGVSIELSLRAKIRDFDKRSVRYVDDIAIGLEFEDSQEMFISHVAAAFSEHGLEMNVEKTRVVGKGERFQPEWVSILRGYRISRNTFGKLEILEDYFKNAFYLSSENEKENVLTYAVKRSRSFFIDDGSWPHYENYLLRCARYHTGSIAAVCQILIERNHLLRQRGHSVDLVKAKRLVVDMIRQYAPLGYDHEVSWALFLCKALKIKLKRSEVDPVLRMSSSSCALITLDLQNIGLVPSNISTKYWRTFANSDGLRSEMWLFAYEIAKKGWLPTVSKSYVSADPIFSLFLSKGIFFYDEKRNVSPTRRERTLSIAQTRRIRFVTTHWEDYF